MKSCLDISCLHLWTIWMLFFPGTAWASIRGGYRSPDNDNMMNNNDSNNNNNNNNDRDNKNMIQLLSSMSSIDAIVTSEGGTEVTSSSHTNDRNESFTSSSSTTTSDMSSPSSSSSLRSHDVAPCCPTTKDQRYCCTSSSSPSPSCSTTTPSSSNKRMTTTTMRTTTNSKTWNLLMQHTKTIYGRKDMEQIGLGQDNGNGIVLYQNRVAVSQRHNHRYYQNGGNVIVWEWDDMISQYVVLAAVNDNNDYEHNHEYNNNHDNHNNNNNNKNHLHHDHMGQWDGFALDMVDHNILVTGAIRFMGEAGPYQGVVRVYQLDESIYPPSWERLGQNHIVGDDMLDYFGHSVSLSQDGRRVVVGAIQHVKMINSNNNNDNDDDSEQQQQQQQRYPGYARVYQRVIDPETKNELWQPVGQKIWGDDDGDRFGNCVAMSGSNIIAVSAPYAKQRQQGHVKVYRFNGHEWIQMGDTLHGEKSNDLFGSALSMNDKTLAVGAPHAGSGGDDNGDAAANGTLRGAVYLYHLNTTTNQWDLTGTIRGINDHDQLGNSVSLHGRRVAIGAAEAGYVQVYEYNGEDKTWQIMGSTLAATSSSSSGTGSLLGSSVSLFGDRVVASAPMEDSPLHEQAGMVHTWDLL